MPQSHWIVQFDHIDGLSLRCVLDRLSDHPAPVIQKHMPIVSTSARPKLKVPSLRKFPCHRLNGPAELIGEDADIHRCRSPLHVEIKQLDIQIVVNDEERLLGSFDDRLQIFVKLVVIARPVSTPDFFVW
jgi:hypothetical protein